MKILGGGGGGGGITLLSLSSAESEYFGNKTIDYLCMFGPDISGKILQKTYPIGFYTVSCKLDQF